ncbi:TetR/AcrR family transcriptional regulator [Natronomonas salsuginis]|uniref:TetR family transcriptional regulator n=1 Tax=Natronomonas salsuginis TaxID=2217661 RepID=A0A4U5J8M1_9EURY|nr:TetR/AcrR family transcriptional regulator [Natronomonas salsuginis]TKR24436.1 TetR family transcriptional regulator [Natronomonas salsuginis]
MADDSDSSRSNAHGEIMRATYRALRDHGYANLTIKRIAEEYGKSTAAVHYHYDTKDELLAAFLDYLLGRFKDTVHEVEIIDPERRLDSLLDQLLIEPNDHRDLLIAMLEMRSQAPYREAFGERFRGSDAYVRYILRTVIEQGVAAGAFDDVDVDHAARALMTVVVGAQTRDAVLNDDESDAFETARRLADEYVSAVLIDDDSGAN